MTSNQIAYLNAIENRRANQAREQETRRANEVSAQIQGEANQIKWGQLTETQKYNALTMALEQTRAAEAQRHSLAMEQETTRHNLAGEAATVSSLTEAQRHNKLTEALGLADTETRAAQQREAKRHNVAQEEAKVQELRQQLTNLEHNWQHMDNQDMAASIKSLNDVVNTILNFVKLGKDK